MYRVLEATVAYATLICTFYYYYYYYYYYVCSVCGQSSSSAEQHHYHQQQQQQQQPTVELCSELQLSLTDTDTNSVLPQVILDEL